MSSQVNVLDKSIPPGRIVFLLAWPAIVEQLLQTLVTYVDAAMVGSVGVDATAAVAVGTSFIWLLIGIMNGVGVGYSVMVGQSIGEGNLLKAKKIIRQSVLVMVISGTFLIIITELIIAPNLARWMGAEESIHQDVQNYISIIGWTMIFEVFIIVAGAIIRGSGDTRTPMIYNVVNNIANIVFNFIFIYPVREVSIGDVTFEVWGMGLGVSGAAVGTALASALSGTLMFLTLFLSKSNVRISLKDDYRFSKSINGEMVSLAVPVAFERVIHQSGQMMVTALATGLGNVALAAHQLANTAESMCFLPTFGFSVASMTLVAQSIGAGDKELAKTYAKLSIKYGVLIMLVTASLLFIFAPQLMGLLIKDSAVIGLGALVLRIQAFAEPCLAITNISSGIFKGTGDTKWPFYIAVIGMWVVRIIPAVILIKIFNVGLVGIWIPMGLDWLARASISLYRFKGDKWLKNAKEV
ncbi:MAG: MATE family efflux transporter [Firmicutes bacterium]|nr:MATE family efflux transporter [Bacillota bacterium]